MKVRNKMIGYGLALVLEGGAIAITSMPVKADLDLPGLTTQVQTQGQAIDDLGTRTTKNEQDITTLKNNTPADSGQTPTNGSGSTTPANTSSSPTPTSPTSIDALAPAPVVISAVEAKIVPVTDEPNYNGITEANGVPVMTLQIKYSFSDGTSMTVYGSRRGFTGQPVDKDNVINSAAYYPVGTLKSLL